MEAIALIAIAGVGYVVGVLVGLLRYTFTGNDNINEAGEIGGAVAVGVALLYVAIEATRLGFARY